jgi:hypothetical protein
MQQKANPNRVLILQKSIPDTQHNTGNTTKYSNTTQEVRRLEMSNNPYVCVLFMSDKEDIFSGVFQARQLFHDCPVASNQSSQLQRQKVDSRMETDDPHERSPVNNLTESFIYSLAMNFPEPQPEEEEQLLHFQYPPIPPSPYRPVPAFATPSKQGGADTNNSLLFFLSPSSTRSRCRVGGGLGG